MSGVGSRRRSDSLQDWVVSELTHPRCPRRLQADHQAPARGTSTPSWPTSGRVDCEMPRSFRNSPDHRTAARTGTVSSTHSSIVGGRTPDDHARPVEHPVTGRCPQTIGARSRMANQPRLVWASAACKPATSATSTKAGVAELEPNTSKPELAERRPAPNPPPQPFDEVPNVTVPVLDPVGPGSVPVLDPVGPGSARPVQVAGGLSLDPLRR